MSEESIPIIDVRDLGRSQTLGLLDDACRRWGFFQVVEHGVPETLIGNVHAAMRTFFAQPSADKRAISRTDDNPWGFYDRELTKNARDRKEIFDYGHASSSREHAQWPRELPTFRGAVLSFYDACERLSFRLLGAISRNLGMPHEYLGQSFRPRNTSFVRLNYYPATGRPAVAPSGFESSDSSLGVHHHTDAGALTILSQDDQPGLEVYRGGRWNLVQPVRGALVVNIGDIVQVWSNDIYQASLHRVRASGAVPRYSAPFFFNPSYDTDYAPLTGAIASSPPSRYRTINWGEFRSLRAAGDYADCGEEVQIAHYRA